MEPTPAILDRRPGRPKTKFCVNHIKKTWRISRACLIATACGLRAIVRERQFWHVAFATAHSAISAHMRIKKKALPKLDDLAIAVYRPSLGRQSELQVSLVRERNCIAQCRRNIQGYNARYSNCSANHLMRARMMA